MDHGVVLSSSVITGVVVAYPLDHVMTGHNNTSGNAMLSRVLPPDNNATYDAVTLRLAFTRNRPSTRVQFRYVFGSNEFAYDTSIGNDAMGAFFERRYACEQHCQDVHLDQSVGVGDSDPRHGEQRLHVGLLRGQLYGDRDTFMFGLTTPMLATGPAQAGWNKIFITLADVRNGATGSWLFI